ncbi:MAG: hypothetical protein QF449_00860 [Alphaproteobacteria bacterium]|jgi:opacity protein-like surface antigen|nr:hypothetical protein [Alphaproteobacteria bacterium]|tara:strand:- start:186 stop:827 length:642 start_codon:yes stop_codon:yes gene_type:complete
MKFLIAAVFTALLFSSAQFAAAQSDDEAKAASVEGFRTAHLGMSEADVMDLVREEFGLDEDAVRREENSLEKTTSLIVAANDLIPESGPSRVAYIFGYNSKSLIQVNIVWGNPIDTNTTAQKLVATANILRNYFSAGGYKNVIVNQPVEVGATVVFRGSDDEGRMVLLVLNATRASDDQSEEGGEAAQRVSLRLSYMENPGNPDIYRVQEGQF